MVFDKLGHLRRPMVFDKLGVLFSHYYIDDKQLYNTSMSIDVDKLKIVFYTNLAEEENEKVVFKREMLHHADLNKSALRLNSLPYFTSQVKYPVDKLNSLSYSEVIDFFFNEKQFVNMLKKEEVIRKGYTEDFNKKQSEVIEHNIKTMFQLLFPTNFPSANDHYTSYDLIHGVKSSGSIFKNPFSSGKFSYLNIANKTYTFKTLVWINDLINHPDYENLFESANKLRETAIDKRDEVKDIQMRNIEKVSELMDEVIGNLPVNGDRDFISNMFYLHFLLYTTLGNSKEDYKAKISEKLGKRMNDFEPILSETLSRPLLTQPDIILKLSEIINSKNVLLSNIIGKLSAKKSDIDKGYKSFKVLDEIVNGEPSKSAFSREPSISAAYKKFEYNLKKYKAPIRKTSNLFLQKIINSSNDDDVTKFFEFFNKVHAYYIENENEKLTPKEDQLLNVGVSEVNLNDANAPHFEICVMVDFFDGELTNENKGKIVCNYTSEALGDDLVKLVEGDSKRNLLWTLQNERKIFSVVNSLSKKSENSNSKALSRGTENAGQLNKYNPAREEEIQKIDNSELYAWLSSDIIKDNAIEGALDKINKFTVPKDWGKDEILDVLMKYNRELYAEIKNLFSKKDRFVNNINVSLVGLRGKYESKVEQNKIVLQNKALDNPDKEEEKNKILFDNELQQLYLIIVRHLLVFVDKLSKATGGKRNGDKRNGDKRNGDKNKMKTIKRRTRRNGTRRR